MFNYPEYLNDFLEKIKFVPNKLKSQNVDHIYNYIICYMECTEIWYGIFKYHIDGDIKMSKETRLICSAKMFNIKMSKEKDMKTLYINSFFKFIESLYDDYIDIYYRQKELNFFNTSKNIN